MKKLLIFSTVMFTFLLILNNNLYATTLGGVILEDTVLKSTESPYSISIDLQVPKGIVLTIEPDVTICFEDGTGLKVGGKLIAVGTANQPIVFTSCNVEKYKGQWKGIEFIGTAEGGSFDSKSVFLGGSVLENSKIEYATIGIASNGESPYIHANQIINNILAINLNTTSTLTVISNNEVAHNSTMYPGDGWWTSGGIQIVGEKVIIDSNYIHNNYAERNGMYAGGIAAEGAEVFIVSNIIEDNVSKSIGGAGGIDVSARYSIISNNTVRNNKGSDYSVSGGIKSRSLESLIEYNLIEGNRNNPYETFGGGGLFLSDRNSTVRRNTIVNNSSSGIGGILVFGYNGAPDPKISFSENNINDGFANNTISNYDISNNYWYTTDISVVESLLIDYYDNIEKGKLLYSPISTVLYDIKSREIYVYGSILPIDDGKILFPDTYLNEQSNQRITIGNSGNDVLAIASIYLENYNYFSITDDTCSNKGISPGSVCYVMISFSPKNNEKFINVLSIQSNDNDQPILALTLEGNGKATPAPDIALDNNSSTTSGIDFSFGEIPLGDSVEEIFTIVNKGDADLLIGSLIPSSDMDLAFVISDENCSGKFLSPNKSCVIHILFSPQGVGDFKRSVEITSNDPFEPTFTLNLEGSSILPIVNNPPSIPILQLPADGALNVKTDATFEWYPSLDPDGDSFTSSLYYSTNLDSLGTNPIIVSSKSGHNDIIFAGFGMGGALLFFTLPFSIKKQRSSIILILALLLLSLCLTSCGGGGSGSSSDNATSIRENVYGLSSNTVYYWKIVVDDGKTNGSSSSEIRSFRTN